MVNRESAEILVVPMRCRRWSCPYCATTRLLAAKAQARAGHPERHIVLTLPGSREGSLSDKIEFLSAQFRRFVTLIRKEFGTFEYMRVLELQKSGSPHLHILARGTYIPFKWLSRTWQSLTGAWMVHIHKITRTSNAINELVKYLAKTASRLQGTTAKTNIITTSKAYRIDDEETDPAYSEKHWITKWTCLSLADVNRAFELFGRYLLHHPERPGVLTLNSRAPPTPRELANALRDRPKWLEEAYDLALVVLHGPKAFAEYLDVETSRDAIPEYAPRPPQQLFLTAKLAA